MAKLSIAAAFRLRNKLKDRIRWLNSALDIAPVEKEAGKPEDTYKLDGFTFADRMQTNFQFMECLCKLNLAIEEANKVNKKDLIVLETVRSELSMFDKIAARLRGADKERFVQNKEGGHDRILLDTVVEQKDVVEKFNSLTMKKEEIEDKLAQSNLTVEVDFDGEEAKRLLGFSHTFLHY